MEQVDEPPVVSGFELTDYQHGPIGEIISRFRSTRRPQWISADRGWGKTYAGVFIAAFLYKTYGFRPLIVAPVGVMQTWTSMLKTEGVPIWGTVTWQSLSGRRGSVVGGKGTENEVRSPAKLSHPWLVRENGDDGPFVATLAFDEALTGSGVFLIFD